MDIILYLIQIIQYQYRQICWLLSANYNVALWVAYYNFLRPHKYKRYQVLNKVGMLELSALEFFAVGKRFIASSRGKWVK